jgi:hypothetical protein
MLLAVAPHKKHDEEDGEGKLQDQDDDKQCSGAVVAQRAG